MNSETRELLAALAKALHEQADNRRERAMIADAQKGGATPDDVVDRWASSFATAYQTLRGMAQACEAASAHPSPESPND